MHVEDGLMRLGSVVLQHVEGGSARRLQHRARDSRQHPADRGRRFLGQLVERRHGFLGDDESVPGREGIHVEERENVIVLVDAMAGNLALDDAAEDGLAHG